MIGLGCRGSDRPSYWTAPVSRSKLHFICPSTIQTWTCTPRCGVLYTNPRPGLKNATRAARCHCTWDAVFWVLIIRGRHDPEEWSTCCWGWNVLYCTSYWESEASHDSGTRDNNVKSERWDMNSPFIKQSERGHLSETSHGRRFRFIWTLFKSASARMYF